MSRRWSPTNPISQRIRATIAVDALSLSGPGRVMRLACAFQADGALFVPARQRDSQRDAVNSARQAETIRAARVEASGATKKGAPACARAD